MITIEVDAHHADVARSNIARANLANRLEVRVGAAVEVLPTLSGPFDFTFIDADKETYVEYFEWAVKLARPGALIVADNVVRKGEVVSAEATDARGIGAQRFNAALAQESSRLRSNPSDRRCQGARRYGGGCNYWAVTPGARTALAVAFTSPSNLL